MKSSVFLPALFIIILTYSCHRNDSRIGPGTTEEIKFNIDSSKLGKIVLSSELKIKFSPPKEWENISEESFVQIKKSMKSVYNDVSDYTIEPKYLFTNETNKSMLIISLIRFSKNDSPFQEKIKIYQNALEHNFNQHELEKTEYLKDNILIRQYLIQKQNQVNFKLLLANSDSDILQFDYSSIKEFYPDEVRGIESSIGSIKHNNFQ